MENIYRGEDRNIYLRLKDNNVCQQETWTLAGMTAGELIMEVDGETYSATFNTSITLTVSNFVEKNYRKLLNEDVIITASGATIIFFVKNRKKVILVKAVSAGTDGTLTAVINQGFLNLNNYPGIIVHLIDSRGQVFKKYSKATLTGYTSMTITDAINGAITLKLNSEDTVNAYLGKCSAELKIEKTDSGFSNNDFHEVKTKVFAEILECKTKDKTTLV